MIHKAALRTFRLTVLAGGSAVLLAACETPLDLDMRGGLISYPNYQVAVARRGDTLTDVANRVGTDVASLARYNGIDPTVPLRKDEIIALPTRVAEPSPATGASGTGQCHQPCAPDAGRANQQPACRATCDTAQSAKTNRPRTDPPPGGAWRNRLYHRAALFGARGDAGRMERARG